MVHISYDVLFWGKINYLNLSVFLICLLRKCAWATGPASTLGRFWIERYSKKFYLEFSKKIISTNFEDKTFCLS
jgi:hypothetical protein